jgi:hypothetical protein
MKHFSILPGRYSNTKVSKTVGLLLLLLFVSLSRMYAAISVSAASGGTNICASYAVGGSAPGFYSIGSIVIFEGATTDFGGTSITFAPPSGWVFNTASLPTIIAGGTGLAVSGAFSSGNLVVTTTLTGAHASNFNNFVIIGLEVQASGTGSSAGNITNSAQAGSWNGLAIGTNMGSLSLEAQPGTVTVGGGGTFCGTSTDIIASGGAGGTIYYQGTTALGTSTSSSLLTQTVTSSGTYYFRPQAASGCWGYPASTAVTLNPLPTVSAGSSVAICAGNNTTLTASGAVTYTWAPGTGLSATTGTTVNASPAVTTTYTVTGTNALSCVNTAIVTVSVNPLPAAIGGLGSPICVGTNATATDVTSGGTWSSNNGNITIGSTSGLVTGITAGTSVVSYILPTSCYVTSVVTVNALPTVSGGSNVQICDGNSTGLTASGAVTYAWSPAATLSASTGASVTATPTVTTTYTVTGTNANGCVNTANVTVTVNAIPTAVTVGTAGTYCGSTTLTASGGTGGTIYYQGTTSGGTSTLTATTTQTVNATGTYYFRAQSGPGCWGTEGSVTVSINPLPAAITASGGGSTTTTFSYTGATQTFTVPSGVTSITIDAYGAAGGNAADVLTTNANGGQGTRASGTLAVTPGQVLQINVGGLGSAAGTGGFNGGGTGGSAAPGSLCSGGGAGGGGGASDVRTGAYALADRVIVGAGGGGSGRDYCNGSCQPCGCGGSGGAGDFNGVPAGNCGFSFGGTGINFGTKGLVGSGGSGGPGNGGGPSGTAGTFGNGGNGASGTFDVSGGGGGGGYYGGGGGGAANGGSGVGGGGGGGGSSYTGGVTGGSTVANSNTGNGVVVLTYSGPGAPEVCVGVTTTLDCTPSGGTWSSSNGNVSIVGSSGVATGITAGTSTITYTITASGCYNTVEMTVNALPTVGGGSDVAICDGNNTSLTATGATTYVWAPAASLSASTGTTVTASPTLTTTYTITGTDGNSCVNTGNVTVSVNPLPAAIGGTATVCEGTTSTLTNATAGGTWSSNNGNITIGSASGLVTGVTAGTSVVSYILPTSCYATTIVTVNPAAGAVTVTGAGTYCTNPTLTASGGTGGTIYYQGTTSGGTSTATASSSQVVSSTGTYYFRAQTALGCWGTEGSAAVTVNALPTVASITPSTTNICTGNALTFTAGSVTGTGSLLSYNWTGPNTYSTTTAANTAVLTPTTTAASGDYSVTVTYAGTGCTSTAAVTSPSVTVNATPVAIAGEDNVCQLANITLTDASSGGTWSSSNTAVGTVDASSGVVYGVSPGTTIITYTLTGPCIATKNITVNPLPTITSTSGTEVCIGTNGTVNATSSVGSIVNWYTDPTAGTYLGTGNAFVVSPGTTTTYYAEASNAVSGSLSSTFAGGNGQSGAMFDIVALKTFSPNTFNVAMFSTYTSTFSIYYRVGTMSGHQTIPGDWTLLQSYPSAGPASSFALTLTSPPVLTAGQTYGFYIVSNQTVAYTTTGVPVGSVFSSNADLQILSGNGIPGLFGGTFAPRMLNFTLDYSAPGCVSATRTAAVVTVNAVPTVASITPSTNELCIGTGITFTSGSVTGTGTLNSYNWTGPNGFSTTTSGNTTGFTTSTTAESGAYSLSVTYQGAGCTSTVVATSPAVTVNTLPTITSITPSPTYMCTGTPLTLTGAGATGTGTLNSYNWTGPNGYSSTTAGNTAVFTPTTSAASGVYSLTVTYQGTGCTSTGVTSSVVTVNTLPTVASITPSALTICDGNLLTFTAGSVSGPGTLTSYNWTGPNTFNTTTSTSTVAMTPTTTASSGYYSLTVTYPGAGCTSNPAVSPYVTVYPRPNIYNVTGGGVICSGDAGVHIGLDWSITGINYQLYNGATAVGSPVAGSASALDFGLINGAGTYTVVATNATTFCVRDMAGSATVTVNPLPTQYNVTGGGTTCENSFAVSVGLANSDAGFTYQLYNGATAVGSTVAGTGAAISFGAQNTSGTYTVRSTNNTTSCVNTMTGSAVVVINPAPTAYNLTGGGAYCSGGAGVAIGLDNSATGINYQLFNGAATVGSPVAGTGSAITFGSQTGAGTYTVLATNTSTSCTGPMSGSAAITINPLPTAYTVTGGGQYCAGGAGVGVGLSFSATGINYQLYNGATAIGSPVAGTGSAISFGNQTLAGTYTVLATNTTTSCTQNMTGSAVVIMNALPVVQTVNGGGAYCAGGAGVPVGLASSESGINYQLYSGPSTVGSPVAGTGSAITFGNQATAGIYTVLATNTTSLCTNAMSGSATVIVNTLPAQFVITGGGNYCTGGSGVAIGLNGSTSGTSYQLYNGASVSGSTVDGTGSAISFGLRTATGTYSAVATNTVTGCVNNMLSSTSVIIDPLPTQYSVTGGGNYCAGGSGITIGLAFSNSGINYQLYNGAATVGSPVAGTGVAISFGTQTAAGTYTVLATNSITTCTNAMTGSATIVIDPLPNPQTVTGGGTYCENTGGVAVGLASSQTGINYRVYNGATAMGSVVAGTGSAISFGNQTLAGTYTVLATDTTTGCTKAMTGSAIVIMNPAPTAYTVNGGGSYCAGGTGLTIGLSSSNSGITYQLYKGAATAGSAVSGTGSAISFGTFTAAGTYTVLATNNTTSCTNPMTGSAVIVINALPLVYNMTGGGSYCAGGTGVNVGVSNSESGINYQLYRGAATVGSPLAGTGAALSFGLQTVAGTYSVLATNATTGCTKAMTGTSIVIMNALPGVYTVTGGGNACSGGLGVHVGLDLSESGINYQAFIGTTAVTTPLGGSGAGIDFGIMYAAGTYTVLATNATTGCTRNMAGSAVVTLSTPPTVYTVAGGGSYCSGGSGVAVGLSGSSTTATYRLYLGGTAVGSLVNGTGAAISLGTPTTAGVYTVLATNVANSCTSSMTGSATVSINALPSVYTVVGGGNYCPGGTGANIGLTGSGSGINYQLYMGASAMGSPVAGSGGSLDMGTYTTVGNYSVVATNVVTGCVSNMSGSVNIGTYTLPTAYTVTGGGSYCSGGGGVSVGLSGSQSGKSYKLYNGTSVIATVAGTGSALNFGMQTASGTYSVQATDNTTSCVNGMTGTVSISINTLPTVYLVTGGGNYCAGGSGFSVTVNGSQTGVNYQLYNGASTVGSPIAGTGVPINFGLQTAAGFYTVRATNATTGCISNMVGAPEIIVNPLPTAYNVTGGGSYCAGGAGVNIDLAGSQTGVSYRLYNGAAPIGAPLAGSGSAISFGSQPVAGTYTILATNIATGCVKTMTGAATVAINSLPTAYNVTGGGGYCNGGPGSPVGLSWSISGTNYQLYKGSVPVGSPLAGVNGALDFGFKTAVGVYTVQAVTTATSCTNNMSGSATISINPLPVAFDVTGTGSYCSGDAGVNILLSGSETGVNYMVYNGATASGTAVAGTGSALDLGPRTAGAYTVLATNTVTSCQNAQTGTANISVNPLPVPYTVTGGGVHCAEAAGVAVGLSSSQTGVSYRLYNGATAVGSAVAGTGSSISFGAQDAAGTYTVLATNTTTSCMRAMTGGATVSVNAVPAVYTVTGGGNFCAGGVGATIGLASSEAGVNYQLYNGSTAMGAPVSGTGTAISFGPQTSNGVYTVMAVNASTSCAKAMGGTATVGSNPLPVAYTVVGGGAYCAGGSGVFVNLSNSSTGISYQLYNGTTAVGSSVPGTGLPLSFGVQSAAGTYTVLATNTTTTCTNAMTASATVIVNAVPVVHDVTGGGAYCAGAAGVVVGVSGTEAGITYSLYNGATIAGSPMTGTGSSLSFGYQTNPGTYTIRAINGTTSCASDMSGSAVVAVNPLPIAFDVVGGGGYCAGGTGVSIAISNTQSGVNYQLYRGSTAVGGPVAGTDDMIAFGFFTTAGVYTVAAVNPTTSCANNMTSDASVVVNALPVTYTVTGGGNYCTGGAGVSIGLNGSEFGLSYQLYNGTTPIGAAISGTGFNLDFGMQTGTGIYTVMAQNSFTTCMATMSGSATVGINAAPVVFNLSSGGSYCAGTAGAVITMDGSETGVNYQLYNGTVAAGSVVSGTGSAIDFGMLPAGNYTAQAVNATTSCTSNMSGTATVTMNTLPTAFAVTGGGGYCSDAAGVAVGLSGSQNNVSYQLYNGATVSGSAVAGNGSAISFGNKTAGTYSVMATNTITGCMMEMTGSVAAFVNAQPNAYAVTGGGNFCAGGTGVNVALAGSQTGVNYRLYNGATAVGTAVAGNGFSLNFGNQTDAGTYTVMATSATTGCTNAMTGSADVIVNALPVAYSITGGGAYCPGGAGVHIGLTGTESGISYQLFNGTAMVGTAMTGTGGAIDFGAQTAAGTYMVVATNTATTCTANMTGTSVVTINTQPTAFTLASSSSSYCAGGTGVAFSLAGSQSGVTYRLYNGTTAVGPAVAGTGSSISFGLKTGAGVYTAIATDGINGCTATMTGSPSISINALPDAYTVAGGGSYCTGGTGVAVTVAGSETGINYQLLNGTALTGTAVAGTGSAVSMNATAAGTYSVQAVNTATGCRSNMNGMVSVVVNPLPSVYNVTGGGAYCAGGTGMVVGLAGSSTGIQYRLYNGTTMVGTAVPGTGAALNFGLQTASGIYTVVATNPITACAVNMTGAATVTTNGTPDVFTVTGGGPVCTGAAGAVIGLSNSATGVNYRLYNGTTAVSTIAAGTGGAITLGSYTTAGTYTVLATNATTGCMKAMSGNAIVTNNPLPTAYVITGGGNYCEGTSGSAIGLGGSSTGVSYKLYHGTSLMGTSVGTGGALFFGTYTTTGDYNVVATNSTTGCVRTMTGSVTIGVTPTVAATVSLSTALGDTLCEGTDAVLTAAVTNGGTAPVYHWMVNGVDVTGAANTFSYTPANGDVVTVSMTSSAACATPAMVTDAVTLTVNHNEMPSVTATLSSGDTLCDGTAVTLTATGLFGGTPSFIWVKNGVPASSGATFTYTPANGDVIYVRMTSNYACRLASLVASASDTLKVILPQLPAVTITADPGTTITSGQSLKLTAIASNSYMPTYQWYLNGGLIHGATLSTFTASNYLNQDEVSCRVTNNTPCGKFDVVGTIVISVNSVGVAAVGTDKFDVRLVPNPSKGDFVVKGTINGLNGDNVALEVTDVLGQVIYTGKADVRNGQINESVKLDGTLANGMYIVSLRTATENKVFHLVLQK